MAGLLILVDITTKPQVNELASLSAELCELGVIIHTAGLSPTMAQHKGLLRPKPATRLRKNVLWDNNRVF